MQDNRQIDYLGVRVADQSISEMDGRRKLLVIPTSEITRMEIVQGSDVKHPIILFLFGIGLVGLGLYPFHRIFHWLMQGGKLFSSEVWLVIWLFLGCYAIFEVVKKKPILEIETRSGTRKIAFRGTVQHQELQEFLQRTKEEFGYTITSRL